MVGYVLKLGELWYHSITDFLTEIIVSIEYSKEMLLIRVIVTQLETHDKVREENIKRW